MTASLFVGREQPLERLQALLEQAFAGRGQACFVTGEAGSGKTALVTEFARRALEQHHDLVAALGQCDAHTGAGDAYLPFREILAQLTGDVEGKLARGTISPENASRLKKLLRFSGQALAEVGPDLIGIFVPGAGLLARAAAFAAEKAGWLERLEKLAGHQIGRASDAPTTGLQQEHIFEQYTNVLRQLAQKQPLLLILDDLQWADAGSLDLLFRLGRRIADSPILLIGTYRPADVALGRAGERHPLEKVRSEFKRYFGEVEIDLAQAQQTEGRAFIDRFLDSEPNLVKEGFRQALFAHTAGHALFTIELLRNMQERGDLVQDEQGRWIEGPNLDWTTLPARVEGVIQARIGRLEQDLREALTIASVEGEDFTAEVVARVQDIEERSLIRQLSRSLEKRHRLISAQGTQRLDRQRLSRYRFEHSLFQKYLYGEMDEAERDYLHEDVGLILEELYGEHTDEIAVQLARHFVEAGLDKKAAAYLRQAGEQAAARFANTEAIDYLSRALRLMPETEVVDRFELLLAREKIYGLLGQREAQKKDLEALGALDERLETSLDSEAAIKLRTERILRQATFAEMIGEYETADMAVREAIELAQQIGNSYLEARGFRGLGFLLWKQGKYGAARKPLERVIQLAQSSGLRQTEAEGLQNLAVVFWRQGDYDRAKTSGKEALSIYRELGDRRGEAQVLGNLGSVYLGQGNYEQASNCYEQSASIDRETGDRRSEAMSLGNLGIIANIYGDFAQARDRFEQVRQIFAEMGDRSSEARALGHLGLLMNETGNYEGAVSYCSQGLQIVQEIGNRQAEGWLLNTLACILHHMSDHETARTYCQQALEISRESGNRSGQAYALNRLGQAQKELGELSKAADAYQRAREIRRELGEHHLATESTAGLADVLLAQGDLAQALSYTEEILTHVQEGSVEGIEDPFQLYLICFRVLQANDDPRAEKLLDQAYELLQEQTAKISDPEMRRSFLANVAAHQEIITLWEKQQTS
jgi:predicted ATPase